VLIETAAAWPIGPTPANINLDKYAGTWYEVAASYLPRLTFERGLACSTAHYRVVRDPAGPYIEVVNRAVRTATKEPTSVTGRAVPLDAITAGGDTVARLSVDFSAHPSREPPRMANYIVIYIGGDYQTAVVTDAFRSTAFLLSRTRTVSEEEYDKMRGAARANGLWLRVIGLTKTDQIPAMCGGTEAAEV